MAFQDHLGSGFAASERQRNSGAKLGWIDRFDLGLGAGVMGMHTDGAKNVVVFFRDRQNLAKFADVGANGQHMADARLFGPGDDAILIVIEIEKVQVTVAIDEHQLPSSEPSSS